MAISATAPIPSTLVVASPVFIVTHPNSKLSHLSSLQFPLELIRSQTLIFTPRPRTIALVASNKENFSSFDELLEKSDKPVLVDFYATWCGPCQFMVPVLEQVGSSMIDKIQIVKIDTEKYPTIVENYSIQALPTFILFKDGEPCDRFEGAMGVDKLIRRIEASLQVKQ